MVCMLLFGHKEGWHTAENGLIIILAFNMKRCLLILWEEMVKAINEMSD